MQNFMKTILSAIRAWIKGEMNRVENKINSSTADWNQNDPNADNYVKNRTHWIDENGVVHKLDKKYLDLPENIATNDDVEAAKQEVMEVAEVAQSTANTAQSTANTAQSTANTAQSTANTAQSTANTAQSTANKNSTRFLEHVGLQMQCPSGGLYYYNGKFIIINIHNNNGGNDYIAYSEDGINWTTNTFDVSSDLIFDSIAYGNGKFVATYHHNGTPVLSYSEDCINWSNVDLQVNYGMTLRVLYGNGKFVAFITYSTNSDRFFLCSEDGINWTEERSDVAIYPLSSSCAYGNGKFVTFGNNGTYCSSEDGINWSNIKALPERYANSDVKYYDGKFIVLNTAKGKVFCSEDGVNWTSTNLSGDLGFSDKTFSYGNGKFVAFDTNDCVYCSEDAIVWEKVGKINNSKSYQSTVYGNGRFISTTSNSSASTTNSGFAYSEDGINWYDTYDILRQNNENITDKVRDLILPINSTTQVGQALVVKSVDENGKPTEWETVEDPKQGKMIVTFAAGTDGKLTADKTVAEILEDHEKGVCVNGLYQNSLFTLDSVGNNKPAFGCTFGVWSGSRCYARVHRAIFMADDSNIYYDQKIFQDAPTDEHINDLIDEKLEEFPEGISVTGATVGQTVKISAVDENGVPTAWESVDFPSDEHINSLINTALGVIENGTY